MNWYYKHENEKVGPVNKDELDELVRQGRITSETRVWNEITSEWLPYREAETGHPAKKPGVNDAPHVSERAVCAECGNAYPMDEMIKYSGSMICASCKPVFFQKIKEGVSTEEMQYAGFWIRFGAKFIDGTILGLLSYAVSFAGGMAMNGGMTMTSEPGAFSAGMGIIIFFQYAIPIAYATYFLGKFAATPGKMACGLKVVTAEGESVSYLRAAGRHLSEYISSLILAIGYIMAAFDQEKRTLHDRICNTRVIRK